MAFDRIQHNVIAKLKNEYQLKKMVRNPACVCVCVCVCVCACFCLLLFSVNVCMSV